MLAAREVVQERVGFSPNELVFGHRVKGHLAVLRGKSNQPEPPKNLITYVHGFRERLRQARELAKLKLEKAQRKIKFLYDRTVERRTFDLGDQVLILHPIVGSPFEAKFDGPFTVQKRISDENYLVLTPLRRKSTRVCHINLMKPYYQSEFQSPELMNSSSVLTVARVSGSSSNTNR